MKVPYSFEDITLSQFMQLHENEIDKSIDKIEKDNKRLSILSGESIEVIEDLSFGDRQELLNKTAYINTPPNTLKVCKRFRAKGTLLVPTTSLHEMKVNQLVDFYSLLKQTNGEYIKQANILLAVMFKPFRLKIKGLKIQKEVKYSPENHAKISELLLSAKVGDCLGLLFFYLDFWKLCEPRIVHCLKTANQTIEEAMKEILNDKEFMDSLNNGDGNIMSINAQKTKG